jgi:hypothetical protein
MKKTKEHPVTFFRKANEARQKVVNSSMKKFALGGPEGGPDDKKSSSESDSKTSASTEQTEAQKKAQVAARASQLASMSGKQYRQEKRGYKRAKKLEDIQSGKQGERVDNVIKAVGSGAEAVANVAGAVKSTRQAFGPREQKRGGVVKRPAVKKNATAMSKKK